MSEFWIKLGEMFKYGLDWISTNSPIIIEWVKNLFVSGGVTAIVFATFKYIVPLLRNNNKPVIKKLKELEEENNRLREEIEEQSVRQTQKDAVILKYINLSCRVNANSITLDDDIKDEFLEINDLIENDFKSTLDEVGLITLENNGNTNESKFEGVLDTVEDVIEVVPKFVNTVQDLKKML